MQASQPRPPVQVPTETRVFTVSIDDVNEELARRQTFGWVLQGTSARSFAVSANFAGAALGDEVSVGGGQAQIRNAHMTDITMVRRLDARGTRLRDLENQYHGVQFQKRPSILAWIAGFAILSITVIGVPMRFGLPVAITVILMLAIFVGLAVLGGMLGAKRRRRTDAQNAQASQRQQAIFQEARRMWGTPG